MTTKRWFRTLYEVLIRDVRVLWLSLLIPVLVIYLTCTLQPATPATETLLRAASILQILGILQVAWGLHGLRVELGQPALWVLFRSWFAKLGSLAQFGKRRVIAFTGTGRLTFGGSAVLSFGAVVNPTIESRVSALESQVKSLQQDLEAKTGQINKQLESLSAETRVEHAKRRKETSQLRELVDRALIGGLDLEAAGLAWILIGQLLSTWPKEMVAVAQRVIQ